MSRGNYKKIEKFSDPTEELRHGPEEQSGREKIKGTFSISGKRKKGFYPKIGQNRHCNRKAAMVHLAAERRRKGAL